MSNYFLDSSALVKRYMPERGTVWIRNLTARHVGHTLVIAPITVNEVMSAIARQYHDGVIQLPILRAFRRQVRHHAQHQYTIVDLTATILTRALDLHEGHRLRAYDAVQLAAALETQQRALTFGETVTFFVC
jgi:uncharacterized protein